MLLVGLTLTACDWVDSTGIQAVAPSTEVFLDDTPVGEANVIDENRTARITTLRNNTTLAQTFTWSETPLQEGNLEVCESQSGYISEFAANNLLQACTDLNQCSLEFVPVETNDNLVVFELLVPELKASVGVQYALTVQSEQAVASVKEHTFCLIAINEAPVANDDTFVIREGVREVISSPRNLLTNDSDDVDDRNQPIAVSTVPASEPGSADFFELSTDGSFVYESSLQDLADDQFDTFEYTLSDGISTSTGKVTLRIVASNQAPEKIDDIPLLEATEGEMFVENLSLYFVDPEQGDLAFTVLGDALPDDGTLLLSEGGLLSGVPGEDDVGTHVLTLVVSDGGRQIQATVLLDIQAARVAADNNPPEYTEGSVFDQIILLGRSIRPITPVFTDSDGDSLTYAMSGDSRLPEGVTINQDTGVISGRPEAAIWVRGLLVEATDSFGGSAVSEPFYIRVR